VTNRHGAVKIVSIRIGPPSIPLEGRIVNLNGAIMSSPSNLFFRIRQTFAGRPDRVCLTTDGGRDIRFDEIEDTTARLARRLKVQGVVAGDRVTVQVDKSPEALFLYLACLRIGAVYMPLNAGYTLAELDYFLNDASPRLVVCTPPAAADIAGLAANLGAAAPGVLTLDGEGGGSLMAGLEQEAPDQALAQTTAGDVAAMLYTSGTTGRSKGALLTQRGLLSNAEVLTREWGFTEADVLVHALPIFHVHGLFVACGCAFLSGARMLFHNVFDADRVIDDFQRASVFMGVPTHYTRLLANPRLTRQATAGMRLFVSGSAPLQPETFHEFHRRTGHVILERYGMTETGMNTSNPLTGERRVGTVGFALPGIDLRIADDRGRPVPRGEVGVIEVRGPNLLKGYWRNPEKTREAIRDDGFFITGDLAQEDPDGYVSIVGRVSDMIISGGYNVYPKEIETIIDDMDGIAESAVFGVPHPDFGEGVVAVLKAREGALPPRIEDVAGALRERLAAFKLPKRILFVDELPRNTMGKVIKAELRKRYSSLFQQV